MTPPSQPVRYPAWRKYFTALVKDQPSQEVLEKLKASQTMVSRWTKGSATPDIARAKEVATLFGGNPEDAERAIRADSIKTVAPAKATAKRTAKKSPRRTARPATTPKAPVGTANNVRSGNPLDKIRAQRALIQRAERDLDEAINAARNAGLSWPEIASALG